MLNPQDLVTILFLALLEGLLSVDNALVLALLVKDLPLEQRKRALTYGLGGAVIFRIGTIFLIRELIQWTWIKWIGGGYLVLIGLQHLFSKKKDGKAIPTVARSFWMTVLVVELSDIAFAIDSILAAVALTNRFWIIFIAGCLGIILIRLGANLFIKLLAKFPAFEKAAYLMVTLIGVKLILEGLHLPGVDFHSSSNPAFWVFWVLLFVCLGSGFRKK